MPRSPKSGNVGRDREVEQAGQALQGLDLGEDRRRLLGADDRDRHDRRAGAHRRLHEAAAAEAAQAVAVLVELLGAFAALGEDEHELALVEEQAMDVGRMGRHGADLRQQHAEAGISLEEVLDGQVQRPRAGVLLLDRLGDHRRVRRQRAGVVGDQQRAALGRHVLDPLDLAAEPAGGRRTRPACGRRSPRRAPSVPNRRLGARARRRAGTGAGRCRRPRRRRARARCAGPRSCHPRAQ